MSLSLEQTQVLAMHYILISCFGMMWKSLLIHQSQPFAERLGVRNFQHQFLFLEIKEELDLEGQMFICGVKGSGVQKVQCDACYQLKVDKKANTNRKREVGETLDRLLFGNRQSTWQLEKVCWESEN